MRLAYVIVLPTPDTLQLRFMEISADMRENESVNLQWEKHEGKWSFFGFSSTGVNVFQILAKSRVMRALSAIVGDFTAAGAMDNPLAIISAVDHEGGRQVVMDPSLKKFRAVHTIAGGKITWEAEALGLIVEAPDETVAKSRLTRLVTDALDDEDKASECEKLIEWIGSGRKVKKLSDGTPVTFVKREVLATATQK